MKLLLITRSDDHDGAARVAELVRAKGWEVFRLETDRFPGAITLSHRSGPPGWQARLTDGDAGIDLAEVTSVWRRRIYIGAQLPRTIAEDLRQVANEEARMSLLGAVDLLEAFHLDPEAAALRGRNKLLQLETARRSGLEVPESLTTNDPEAVRAFAAAAPQGIIAKMLSSFAVQRANQEQVVFASDMKPADLAAIDSLRLCPMTFQHKVPRRAEVRVTVIGKHLFSAALDADTLRDVSVDWRRVGNRTAEQWREHPLPAAVERAIFDFMNRMGLNYGALDFIQEPSGRYVFLEVNAGGEYHWLERGGPRFPLSEAFADVLTNPAARRLSGDARPAQAAASQAG